MSDIGRVYARRRLDYLRVAAAVLGDRESASDALQEAFVTAIRCRRKFRCEGSLEGWIWTIVVNVARDQRRRSGHARLSGEPAEGSSLADRTGDPDLVVNRAALRGRIARLPERQRLILFLRFYADLDYAHIGRLLGVSAGTVGATIHSALRSLDPAPADRAWD